MQQQKNQLSAYSDLYDLIVPKDNLKKINELIDFSFIHDELVDKYRSNNGRNAHSPVRMFKYLLLKTFYSISDADVVERSRYDMSFKYFLEMAPEDAVINSSSLNKFRKLRLKDTDLLNLLINKTVTLAIEKGIISSKSIIADATHSLSRSNPYSALEVLRERSKLLRKAVYAIDEEMKVHMPKKNLSRELEEELTYCKELEKCIESDQKLALVPAVKDDRTIKIVAKLNPAITQGCRKKEDKFDYNKDVDMFVCPGGHLAIRKARQGKKDTSTNQTDTYYFDIEKCKICPLQQACYKP